MQVGSSLHLECRIHGCQHPAPSWRHAGYPLEPDELEATPSDESIKVTKEASDDYSSHTKELEVDGSNRTILPSDGGRLLVDLSPPSPVASVVSVTRHDVTPRHSGIYTCTSTCTAPVNVTVHVLRGKYLKIIKMVEINI